MRWQSWLTSLGAGKVTSATSVLLAALRDIRDAGELAVLREVGTDERRSVPGRAARAGAWQMAARD